jgi:hypothetical protein
MNLITKILASALLLTSISACDELLTEPIEPFETDISSDAGMDIGMDTGMDMGTDVGDIGSEFRVSDLEG